MSSLFKTLVLCSLTSLLFIACGPQKQTKEELNRQADELFETYISAYTQGRVSSQSAITVQLAQDVSESNRKTDVLKFFPSVKGKTQWLTPRVIEFRPDRPLSSGSSYLVNLDLKELDASIPEELEAFEFVVDVIKQDYDLRITGQRSDEADPMKRQIASGELVTADVVDTLALSRAFSASQLGDELTVKWDFDKVEGTNHSFSIENIQRTENPSQVNYQFDGSGIGVKRSLSQGISVPALGDFKVVESNVVKTGDAYVLVRFSDPLNPNQNLKGLITLEGDNNLRFTIEENEVKAYTSKTLSGEKRLQVYPGIKNRLDYAMNKGFSANISFAQIKPQVRLNHSGTILPSTDGLVLPFEAVNLQAVDVTIVQVFEKNVIQFLQTNNLNGDGQMRRVGRPVYTGTVPLDASGVMDLTDWNRFTLDLADLIESEPGAIYQVRLNFKKNYSLYTCGEDESEELDLSGQIAQDDWSSYSGENSGSYDSYYDYGYGSGYEWSQRENPCHVSYYSGTSRMVKTNIMASDLGLIAKIGNDRKMSAFVTDLRSTQPVEGATIEVYDFQQDLIGSTTTDRVGEVSLDLARKPFVMVAKRGLEQAYLKLWDARSLSVSNFNVGGSRVERGLNGFIYGERGVWRPGDIIYLNFILQDAEQTLPEDHPVILELVDPSGTVKARKVSNGSNNGFYHFPLKTEDSAPTGNWLARVKVGGTEFTKRIKIETIKPNRLKIDLSFDKDRIVAADNTLSGDLNVQWLSGAPARNLKAEFDLYLSPMKTTFQGFSNYSFDDLAKDFRSETQRVFSGNVDETGFSKVNVSLNKQATAPGALRASFSGKVYEPGGDFSIDQFSIPFYPYESFVGIKKPEGDRRGQLLTEKNHTLEIVSVDADGNPISKSGLVLEVFKLNWRWWWDRSADNLSYYISRNYNQPYLKENIRTVNGRTTVDLNIPNRHWGRYYIRVRDSQSGHSAGAVTYFDWPGWADASRPGGASLLNFSTDAEDYQVGNKAKINIPASTNGRALVSIENGTRVVASYWLDTKEGANELEFEVTKDMVPNVYVNTTLLQPHAQTRNDLPMRLYGIVPINVTDPSTQLNPVLTMDEILEPESEVTLEVSEAYGQPMTYTVAIVDEGLLDITRFNTPNPWGTFFARQALGVKTWDVYDDVIGAFNGDLSRLLALGGDGSGSKPEKAKANRFKPVVTHLGPFDLEAGESAEHTFNMPNYVGSVRTMVIAGNDRAYGNTEKATPVRKPLMVLGTLPRVIGPGEKVKLPISVFALESSVQDVEVTVKGNDLLKVVGSPKQRLKFNQIGDQIIDFELDVAENLGVGEVEIEARSGREVARYKVEIQVRNANPVITDVKEFTLNEGETLDQTFTQMGMEGTNGLTVEMSVIPPIDLKKRLEYLLRYPHGCIEQTTSAAFPQLFLDKIMDLSSEDRGNTEQNIKRAIDRISLFQTATGGFAYWPGQSDENDWGTNYAGHFLLEAKDQGYFVPDNLIRDWRKYQRRKARSWSRFARYNDDLVQAYRLYTLAKAQAPELGAMNRLREDKTLGAEAKWRLAAAYALAGKSQIAKEMINDIPVESVRKNHYYYYGSKVRDDAMILETLGLLNMQQKGLTLLRSIAGQLSANQWMSTQTTAYALLSVIKFAGVDQMSKGVSAGFKFNDEAEQQFDSERPLVATEVKIQGKDRSKIKLENKGSGVLFVRVIQTGQPLAGDELSGEEGLRMAINYTDRNGQNIDPSKLPQGTDFFAEVSVYNPGTSGIYKDLALSQIFPSGWEILNDRLNDLPGNNTLSSFDYQDIRDDRVYTYFDLKPNERKRFKVALNATYSGKYYLPAVKVEAMYDHTINARSGGKWVEVTRAN